MIRIPPLEQRTNYDAILELYFYMTAMMTPFSPEDIYPAGIFYEQGDIQKLPHPVKDFYVVTGKHPRRRNKRYKALLRHYGITKVNETTSDRQKNDALLAKRIIGMAFWGKRKNKSLYYFLYENNQDKEDFHVDKDHLHSLLTSYMDDESLKQAGLCFDHHETGECNVLSACKTCKAVISCKRCKVPVACRVCKMCKTPTPRKAYKAFRACKARNDLAEVFQYTKFAARPEVVQLMGLLKISVCPYCNRNFITTISSANGGTRQGQFDHYRSKSKEPWFALSLRNLVPACGYCNHKKSDETDLVLYPYKEGMDSYYRFRTRPVHGIRYLVGAPHALDEFEVVGEFTGENGPVERVQNSLRLFHLKELYQTNQEHIAWIFRQRYIFSDAYLKQLC